MKEDGHHVWMTQMEFDELQSKMHDGSGRTFNQIIAEDYKLHLRGPREWRVGDPSQLIDVHPFAVQ
jgi:hypothetical protein